MRKSVGWKGWIPAAGGVGLKKSGGRGGNAGVSGSFGVVDADLTDYFGSIPHAELLKSVARRIVDRHVLHLIKMWLTSSFWSKTSRVERQPPLQNPDSALARADRPLLAQGHKAATSAGDWSD